MGSEIIRRCGPDSYAGRVAAVMLGASETSLYTCLLCTSSENSEISDALCRFHHFFIINHTEGVSLKGV